MTNNENDYLKHLETTRAYLQALAGYDDLEYMSAEDMIEVMAKHLHGLNGGSTLSIDDAAEIVGFNPDAHVVRTGKDTWQVMVMIEFDDSEEALLDRREGNAPFVAWNPRNETIN